MKFRNIETFSIIAGSRACNARCPFCISKMTPENELGLKEPEVNWRNFRKACMLAKQSQVNTVMVTGKGEPTLFPEQLTKFFEHLSEFNFPFIELQTNGILLAERFEFYQPYLEKWHDAGLNTIAISVVHYDAKRNQEIYSPYKNKYIDLPKLITNLHKLGFIVRLAVIMLKGYIDDSKQISQLIKFSQLNQVEQLTLRPINKPDKNQNPEVYNWTSEHLLTTNQFNNIKSFINSKGISLLQTPYGATIFDIDGQNVCLTNSLTLEPKSDELRQIIFFPDGHLYFDWRYKGAILL